jgi:dipeptidyl aminopeptidase/acylaminoacyl peptidase
VKHLLVLHLVLLMLFSSAPGRAADAPADGTIVEQSACTPDPRVDYAGFECYRLRYWSDGLQVVGYLWKPKHTAGATMPLVIFNRGGNRERSKLTPWMANGFREFVAAGFAVLASQYRGVDGGEGMEQYGGDDIHDVLNLFPLARSLGYLDMDNVFLFGHSRGGMMTYLALKANAPVRAAAVTSGVANLSGNAIDHPDLIENVFKPLIPDFAAHREERMRERSAVEWPERLNVPLLIMHGAADQQISATRTLELAQKLQALGKTYELVIYAGDDHGLSRNRIESDRRIIEWFRAHMAPVKSTRRSSP